MLQRWLENNTACTAFIVFVALLGPLLGGLIGPVGWYAVGFGGLIGYCRVNFGGAGGLGTRISLFESRTGQAFQDEELRARSRGQLPDIDKIERILRAEAQSLDRERRAWSAVSTSAAVLGFAMAIVHA